MTVEPASRLPIVPFADETCPRHRNHCQRSGVNPGRSAVSRQSDVGREGSCAKFNLASTHTKARVAIGIRQSAGFACRGVGHTARGREMPRELHLMAVRLPYLISPRVSEGSLGFPAFWCAAAWCDVRSTHKRSSVRKRIQTSGHELEDSSRSQIVCRVLRHGRSFQLSFLDCC